MLNSELEKREHYHISVMREGELLVRFGEHMDVSTADVLFNSLLAEISKIKPGKLTLDLAETRHVDEYGLLALIELQEMIVSRNGRLEFRNVAPEIQATPGQYH